MVTREAGSAGSGIVKTCCVYAEVCELSLECAYSHISRPLIVIGTLLSTHWCCFTIIPIRALRPFISLPLG